jgi:GDSL-like Lipase/Acylhydrolase family
MMAGSGGQFWRSTVCSLALMAVLAGGRFAPVPSALALAHPTVDLVRRTVTTRGLSAEAREEQTAGYYQGLLDQSAAVVVRAPGSINVLAGGPRVNTARPALEELDANAVPVHENLHSFLIYRPRPYLNIPDPRFRNVRHVTNAFGFADREYALERTPNTRRLVILGDSMARALGVEPGQGFEALLEDDWNRNRLGPEAPRFELINMGVAGYRITQVMDLALEEGPRFKPDAYVLVLSWLTVARKWGLHIAQLAEDGIDFKYDFLRNIARDAGLKPGDTTAATEAKLWSFREPTLRWAIGEIRARARADGADLVVVLMPHLKGIGGYESVFGPIKTMLRREGIPLVDVLDAFDGRDITMLDVGDGLHPNATGHRILSELLQRRIGQDTSVASILFGNPRAPAAAAVGAAMPPAR